MSPIRSYGWTAAIVGVTLLACVGDAGQPLAPSQVGPNVLAKSNGVTPVMQLSSPLVSTRGAPPPPPPPPAGSDTLSFFVCKDGKGPYAGAAVIGPAGGQVVFGPHSLIVPAGSLSAPTPITAATLHGDTLAVTFGPSGLQFRQPAELVLSYGKCKLPPSGILHIVLANNRMNEIIQLVPSQDKKLKQRVEGLIQHFSVYAASESRR